MKRIIRIITRVIAKPSEIFPLFKGACHRVIGHVRRLRVHVLRSWPGEDPLSKSPRHAVYAHYDQYGRVHDYVMKQLEELVAAGFRITFVSNSPIFSNGIIPVLAPLCRQILLRRNAGYDFGAYKDGIRAIGNLDEVERLLLMNDSVYGPFFPLTKLLATIDPSTTDVWGITDSWQHHYHIQSYFVVFLRGALLCPSFQTFWRNFPYVNWKEWVIHHGEIALTQVLKQQKLRPVVLAPYWSVAKLVLQKLKARPDDLPRAQKEFLDNLDHQLIVGVPMNPTHAFWETLVTDFGCPFLKREVIGLNPMGSPLVWRWDDAISKVSDYDPKLIFEHLQTK